MDLKKLEAALNERTVLVSIMHANNEVGTIQPIAEIAGIIKARQIGNGRTGIQQLGRGGQKIAGAVPLDSHV